MDACCSDHWLGKVKPAMLQLQKDRKQRMPGPGTITTVVYITDSCGSGIEWRLRTVDGGKKT